MESSADFDHARERNELVRGESAKRVIDATVMQLKRRGKASEGRDGTSIEGCSVSELAIGFCRLAEAAGKPLSDQQASRYAVKAFRKYDILKTGRISEETFVKILYVFARPRARSFTWKNSFARLERIVSRSPSPVSE
jgi:hypothetical protein